MGFADARRAEEDDVFAPLHEAELVETLQLLTPERRVKREIKLGEPFDRGQPAGAHRSLQTTIVAQLDLRAEQLLDGLGCGERGTIDAGENRIERLERARQRSRSLLPAAESG